MAVSIDDLVTPLPADGSAIRDDLIYLAGLLKLTIPVVPSNPGYQLVSTLGRWGTYFWNTYGIPAIAAQFGELATGDWLTLWARAQGTDQNLATFASAPIPVENRSNSFHDLSAPGAMQITNPGGFTFTSQGPAPGSSGTVAAWSGSGAYPTTILTFEADVAGSASNTTAATIPGYPAAPASAPPGVYVVQASQPAILGSDKESDPALLQRTRANVAGTAPLAPPELKIRGIALSAQLPGGIPVSVNRVRVVGGNATMTVYLASPGGPSPGNTTTPGTDVYQVNAALQLACASPGLSITVTAASSLSINLGTATLYVTAESGVTATAALATAQAAFNLWSSSVMPVGGRRLIAGGQGYVLLDEVIDILQSAVNSGYPAAWKPNTYYALGAQVSNDGQTFSATAAGTSGSLVGPTGQGGADGNDGLVWSPLPPSLAGSQFIAAPGVYNAKVTGMTADVAIAVGQVAVFTVSFAVVVVPQGV